MQRKLVGLPQASCPAARSAHGDMSWSINRMAEVQSSLISTPVLILYTIDCLQRWNARVYRS